jgi:putative transposase
LLNWAGRPYIRAHQIRAREPQRNAWIERHNHTVHCGWLTRTPVKSIEEVQDIATCQLWTRDHERPNMALGGITPLQQPALAV